MLIVVAGSEFISTKNDLVLFMSSPGQLWYGIFMLVTLQGHSETDLGD